MLYIITEDSNSARAFWELAAKEFRGSKNYVLVPLLKEENGKQVGGNTTLENQVNELLPKIKRGDELFVVFDYISNTSNFIPGDFIISTYQKCKNAGIDFKFTSYYCFEELYLSYIELYNMINNNKTKTIIINTLKFIQDSIKNGGSYFNIKYKQIIDFIDFYGKDSGKNREHFANALLISITQLLDGRFKIIKSGDCFYNQGACWLLNCDDVRKLMSNKHEINSICDNKCKFKCKDCTTREKLIDLNNNSMLAGSTYNLTEI